MSKTKVKCTRCHSDQLYKFGLNKQANQKYQCKKCKRQFAPDSVSKPKESKYPKCGKATFLYHAYKHYNRYKCGNKKCNHVIVHHHNLNTNNAFSENLTGSLSMKGMRFPLHVILTALTLYFLNNTSTRAISHFLYATSNIKVSHVTISSWVHKFTPFFKQKANSFKSQLNLQSDDWHAELLIDYLHIIKL